MATQTYNDGSYDILKNSEGDKGKLNYLIKQIKELTEPNKINNLISKMIENGLLNKLDVVVLKEKGIYIAEDKLQQAEKNENIISKPEKDLSVDDKDDIEDIEL